MLGQGGVGHGARPWGAPRPDAPRHPAKEARIHRSVAHDDLERLVTLGCPATGRRQGFPGKPAKVYKLTAGPVQISHPMRRYDLLPDALATEFLRLGDGATSAIKHAGLALGASLARGDARSIGAALEPLSELGGEYQVSSGGAVSCENCLFAEVCRRTPVICTFHAGALEGLLEHSTVKGSVEPLGHRGPNGCAYRVHPTDRSDRGSGRALTAPASRG